jgi:hypothetical protein
VKGALPVDASRLQKAFPTLTPEDLQAYEEVTRRLLEAGHERGALLKRLKALGSEAEGTEKPSEEATLALRYLRALAKMQGPGQS